MSTFISYFTGFSKLPAGTRALLVAPLLLVALTPSVHADPLFSASPTMLEPYAGDCIDYSQYLKLVGRLKTSGVINDMAVADTHAYISATGCGWGCGVGLGVVDVSNPTYPTIVGSVDLSGIEGASGSALALGGNYVYVLVRNLKVVDISNPTSPTIVGSLDIPGDLLGVVVDGTYAYVANGDSGLRVVDISDPASPVIVGSVETPGDAANVAVAGTLAYVADAESGLQVVDISNPTSPVIVGGVDTPGVATEVAVSGSHAVVADWNSGVQIVDISNPASPNIVGNVDTPGFPIAVTVFGIHAYVGDVSGRLHIVNISDPAAPAILTSEGMSGGVVQAVEVAEGHVYLGTSVCSFCEGDCGDHPPGNSCSGDLMIVDASHPTSPTIVGSVETPGPARRLAVAGTRAYVADIYNGLQVVDISNPAMPAIVDAVHIPDITEYVSVAVAATHAYVADIYTGLQVVDISNHASPAIVGNVAIPTSAKDVAVAGSYAYVVGCCGVRFHVVDISDPTSPAIVGSVLTPGDARAVAVAGTHAYVADGYNGLQVVDIANPDSPAIVGGVFAGYVANVAVAGTHAYLAALGTIEIVDISDPTSPMIVASVNTPGGAGSVAVAGPYAYVTGGRLTVIDISDPQHPQIVGDVGVGATDAVVAGSHVYLTGSYGLKVLPTQCQPTTAVEFDFSPGILNLPSRGLRVTGYLEPLSPFAASDIDVASIRLNGTVPVDPAAPTALGDHDGNGIPDLMVKFNRAAVELTVSEGDDVAITVTGTMDGQSFTGTDQIIVRRAAVPAPKVSPLRGRL